MIDYSSPLKTMEQGKLLQKKLSNDDAVTIQMLIYYCQMGWEEVNRMVKLYNER